MLNFQQLQQEVKRRATKDQAGTTFDTAVDNLINTSLFRIARECPWRPLRRETYFTTETSYSTGTGAVSVTADSTSFSVTGATFITDGIKVGRRIKFGTDSVYYTIRTITSETEGTIDKAYGGTTSTTTSYEILPTETYNLPIQVNPQRDFLWHNQYGYPMQLEYVTEQDFRGFNINDVTVSTPLAYRMWGQDMVLKQLTQPSVIQVISSSSADTTQTVTIMGTVSGYPDFEVINLNGASYVTSNKTFSYVERVSKSASTTGRITISANSTNDTVAVIPVGEATLGVFYPKIRLYPLPDAIFPINICYYKDPWALVNDGDIHEIGADFDEAIILLATAKIKYESSMNEDGDKFIALYIDEIKSLRRTNMDKIDFFATLRNPSQVRGRSGFITKGLSYLQLGGNYGPRSYR